MTVRELHSLAARQRIPAGILHDFLHDLAEGNYKVKSLTQLTPEQLDGMAELVLAHSGPAPRHQAPPRRPYSDRERRGRPAIPGVVKMAPVIQRELMYTISNEIRWPASVMKHWLEKHFKVSSLNEVLTASMATQVINLLKLEKKRLKLDRPASPPRPQPPAHKEVPVAQTTLF